MPKYMRHHVQNYLILFKKHGDNRSFLFRFVFYSKSRKYRGMFEVHSPEQYRQVREKVWSQQVEYMQVLNGTGPGVRRSKLPLSAWPTILNVLWKPLIIQSLSSVIRLRIGLKSYRRSWLVGWLVGCMSIYVALAVFQPYGDLQADDQSRKFKWRGEESNPGPLAPQAKSLTTRPPPLPYRRRVVIVYGQASEWHLTFVREELHSVS